MRLRAATLTCLFAAFSWGCTSTTVVVAEPTVADTAPVATYLTLGNPAAFDAGASTVLITGANRGIGLEFVNQYSQLGWNIIATARSPAEATELQAIQADHTQLVIEELDVTDEVRLTQLSEKYAGQTIDVLLSNAGITPRYRSAFRKLEGVDWQMARDSFNVNALAPLQLAQAFIANVEAAENGKIVVISSKAGSFELGPKMPMMYGYRASKAALNMFMYTLSFETEKQGVILVMLSPGQVNTTPGMRMPIAIESDESVSKMLAVIDALTPEHNGQFLDYEDGRVLEW